MKATPLSPKERLRRQDLGRIHAAKKALGWDDETYRDILQQVCQVRSAKELDGGGRARFLQHLERCGWRPLAQPAERPVRGSLTEVQRKMFSLWQQLADAGAVKSRRMQALQAFAERTTQVARLEWLNQAQEALVVATLKQWLKRLPQPAKPTRGGA